MKRNSFIPLCIGILLVLPIAGCVCATAYPTNYCGSTVSFTERPCAPCGGTADCGEGCADEVGCGSTSIDCNSCVNSCASPCIDHGIINCQSCLSNIGNGIRLIGRGVLDAAAVPFIVAGKVLSSGCRYEVIADCSNSGLNFSGTNFGGAFTFGGCPGGGCSREVYYGDNYLQPQDLINPCVPTTPCNPPCSSCIRTGNSGCSSCAGKQTEGTEYSSRQYPPRAVTVAPPIPHKKETGVIQASHQEPSSQSIRFVKPR